MLPGNGGAQVPLSAVAQFERGIAPLVVNHQGQFPAATISYNLAPGMTLDQATAASSRRSPRCILPDTCTPSSPATRRPSRNRSARSRC